MARNFRERLEGAVEASGHTLKSLSVEMGRNHAYLQQYVKRGSPRVLPEDVREQLAGLLGGHPDDYRDPASRPAPTRSKGGRGHAVQPRGVATPPVLNDAEIVTVPVYDLAASAGPGSIVGEETPTDYQPFKLDDLRHLTRATSDKLAILEVAGDSMEPTLRPRDRVLIDRSVNRLRGDGIYVILVDDTLLIKRLSPDVSTGEIVIQSDNARYETQRITGSDRLRTIGQVVWVSRAIV